MQWGVLGPIEIWCGGEPAPVGGSRERTLLARLLVSANQVVAQDTLIADLWDDTPPERAEESLWVYISRLRKLLRAAGADGALETRPPGYRLRVGPGELDADRFAGLTAEARSRVAAGDPAGAAARFREGLGLWRGPALADVATTAFARAAASRLEEARLGVTEECIEAELDAGGGGELTGELAALTGAHPLRERLWALRMTALYRAGRQAEALRAYQELRLHLADGLGIEPSEELRVLEVAILRQDAGLGRPQPPHPAEEADRPPASTSTAAPTSTVASTPGAAQPDPAGVPVGARGPGPGTGWRQDPERRSEPGESGGLGTPVGGAAAPGPPPVREPAPAPERRSEPGESGGLGTPVEGSAPPPAREPAPGVVVFVFTDLVGSTELLDRLGDDAADEVRRRHFSSLRQALATHGGAEVKSLGDGLMAAFASPVAALRCAVEIQRDAAGGGEVAAAVRIGIHAGEPIAEDDDYFGTPVVVAQRLCGLARGGQIVTSALVQGLAGSRAGCTFNALGGLSLKGFAEPVAACEVVWADPAAAEQLPLPLPLERPERTTFVGRDGEMARLERTWEVARAGERRVVLLAGEPGIGKTRLAAEIAAGAHAEGAAVLFGRCDEGMGVPYQPFVEALTTYLGQADGLTLGPLAGELSRLVPEIRGRVDDLPPAVGLDPETDRYRLFQAVAGWLAAMAAETPLVLVVDDLHWATPPTLALLSHISRATDPVPMLIVVTYRDTDLDVTTELSDALAGLLRHPVVERVRVSGLDEAGVAAFLAAGAREALGEEGRAFVPTLHRETGGNPFYVGQVLRHLTETGAVARRDGRWVTTDIGIPEGLADVISRRLARLPGGTRGVLAQAAVLGETFDLRVLVRAAGPDEVAVLDALDPAIAARLVAETAERAAGYRFVHALVRSTVYEGLPSARRLELHGRAAEAIEAVHASRLDDHLPALAQHFARSGSAHRDRAVEYATRAGDRSGALLAHGEAARWYRQALDLLEDPTPAGLAQRCDVLTALGAAQRLALDPGFSLPLAEAVRIADQLEDAERLARAALAQSRGTFSEILAADRDRIALYRRALTGLGPADSVLRARLLGALTGDSIWASDESVTETAVEALEVAHRLGDPLVLGHVLAAVWPVLLVGGSPGMAEAWQQEQFKIAGQAHDPFVQFMLALLGGAVALTLGDGEAAERYGADCDRLGLGARQPFVVWLAQVFRAGRALLAGRLAEAEELASQASAAGSATGIRDAHRLFMGQLFWLRYEQGRLTEVVDAFLRGAKREGAHPMSRALLCLALCETGRGEEARPDFELLVDRLHERAVPLPVFALLAQVAVALDDTGRAAKLRTWLLPHERYVSVMTAYTVLPIVHYLGILAVTLGDDEAASGHFAAALALAERMQAPTFAARTRLAWATMLARRGRPEDSAPARELAAAALATADELGLARIAADARTLLAGQ